MVGQRLLTALTSLNNKQTTTTRSQQPLILDQSTMIGQSLVLLIVLLVSPSSSWIFQLSQQQKIRHSSTSNYKYQRLQAYSRRRFVHNSVSEDKHEGERKKEKESLGNVDLFAAGEKRHRDKHPHSSTTTTSTTTIAPLKPSTSSVASSGKDFERKDEADVTTASSGGLLTAQAELLRMEAEKEALMVEQERLAERKEMLRQIDSLLLSLLRSLSVSSSPSDVIRVFVAQNKAQLRKEFFLRLAELANHEIVVAEKQRLYGLYEEVLQVLSETDASQYSQIVADVSKEINQEIFSSASSPQRRGSDEAVFAGKNDVRSYEQVLQSWLQQLKNETIPLNVTVLDGSAVANNFTSLNNMLSSRIFRLPSALPLDFVPDLMKAPTLTDQEVTLLKSRVFSKDLFEDLYDVEASPVISVVRGVPKGSYHDTLLKLQQRLSDIPELREKVQIVLYPEYKSSANSSPVSKSGGKAVTARRERFGVSSFEPVFIVFSKEVKPVARSTFESVGSVLSMLVGVFTAFTYSIGIFAFNQDFFNKALQGDPEIVTSLIPVTFGVLFLQLVHDLAHIVVARSRDVTLGFPSIVIPSLQIGVYGSVTRFLSFVKDRKDLFDVSIAGPLAGFLSSFGCTIAGLLLTATSSPTSSFPTLPLSFFQSSSLFFSLVDQYLHLSSSVAPDALVAVHPLVMIGYAGLVANALNFLPLGKLDGGRVLMSIIGRRTTSLLTVLFLFAQGISLIFFASGNASPLLPFWLITVAFLQRNLEAPPIDDVTPIPSLPGSSERDAAYWLRLASVLLCSVLAVGMLLPVFGATSAPPPLPPFPPLSPGGGGSGVI